MRKQGIIKQNTSWKERKSRIDRNWRYQSMKGSMSTELGIITISPEVIAKYAGSVAVECFGIVGMAAVNM